MSQTLPNKQVFLYTIVTVMKLYGKNLSIRLSICDNHIDIHNSTDTVKKAKEIPVQNVKYHINVLQIFNFHLI